MSLLPRFQTVQTEFAVHCCPCCGVTFAIEARFDKHLARGDLGENDERVPRTYRCPNGHKLYHVNAPEPEETPADLAAKNKKLETANRKLTRDLAKSQHDLEVCETKLSATREAYEQLLAIAETAGLDASQFKDELRQRGLNVPAPVSVGDDGGVQTKAKPRVRKRKD